MLRPLILALSGLLLLHGGAKKPIPVPPPPPEVTFTPDGQLNFPTHYRDWVFLTAGIDMSYTTPEPPGRSVFENIFVNPAAYRSFQQTGTWPDKTLLMIEVRPAGSDVSINKRGKTQMGDARNYEVHVKDASLPGKWGFYEFSQPIGTAKILPQTADCYTCHQTHAAVDTTFVQFYPTLIPIATEKGTYHLPPN